MADDAITNLYSTIKTKADTLKTIEATPEDLVTHFSFWNGDIDANFKAIKRNLAVFFSVDNIDWTTTNNPATLAFNQESGICQFTLRVARKSLKDDESATLELLTLRN